MVAHAGFPVLQGSVEAHYSGTVKNLYDSAANLFGKLGTGAQIRTCLMRLIASGGATPGRARSNDLAGRSTALVPPWLRPVYCFALLR